MADDIRLITWSGQNVKPVNDANVYEAALGVGGVKYGCIVTASGANTLSISAGNGVLCGRAFEIFDCTKQVQLSGSGTLQGRVFIHLDLSNTEEPISIQTQTGNSITPPIQQENINVTNGIYEINLATFNVSPSAISNVVNVAPVLDLQADLNNIKRYAEGVIDWQYVGKISNSFETYLDFGEGAKELLIALMGSYGRSFLATTIHPLNKGANSVLLNYTTCTVPSTMTVSASYTETLTAQFQIQENSLAIMFASSLRNYGFETGIASQSVASYKSKTVGGSHNYDIRVYRR